MHPSLQDYIRSTVLRSEVGSQAPLEGVQVREVVVGHGADQPVRGHGADREHALAGLGRAAR